MRQELYRGRLAALSAVAPLFATRSPAHPLFCHSTMNAADRTGMAGVIVPHANRQDVKESFGDSLRPGLDVHYALTMDDVLNVALPDVLR